MSPIYRGYPAMVLGLIVQQEMLMYGVVLAQSGLSNLGLPAFFLGLFLSHPFFLISKRVQFSPHYTSTLKNAAFRDSFSTAVYTYKTEGLLGFYRGFVPSFLVYCSFYLPYVGHLALKWLQNDEEEQGSDKE